MCIRDRLRDIQRDIYQQGFEAVASQWIGRLDIKLDDFARWRAQQFLELARQFDQSGSRDIDAFLRYVPAQEITEASGASVVQVMTIHKAKGLTFDITIVPDLEGKRLDQARNEALHTQRKNDGEADWILDLPSKDICMQDDSLKDSVAEARSEACYESFCKLYVALTRSSHGLYVITAKPGNSENYAQLLTTTLATGEDNSFGDESAPANVIFEEGSFDWVRASPVAETKPVAKPNLIGAKRGDARLAKRRATIRPRRGARRFFWPSRWRASGAPASRHWPSRHPTERWCGRSTHDRSAPYRWPSRRREHG